MFDPGFGVITGAKLISQLIPIKSISPIHITLEQLRMGALNGLILDADGTVIYDLYDEFDITPQTVNFVLGNAETNVKKKCADV